MERIRNLKAIANMLINEQAPFEKITEITGWSEHEIWLYIDMVYRKENPQAYTDENNKSYFCWGPQEKTKTKMY